MASQIVELYEALRETSITINGKAVRVKGLEEIPSALDTAGLPVRMLTPISQFLPQNAQSAVWAKAGSSVITQISWSIADVMYWQPVAQNIGIRAVTDDLVVYMREYLEMMKSFEPPSNGLSTLWVANVGLQSTVLEYPLLSGKFYYAVAATLTVTEKM